MGLKNGVLKTADGVTLMWFIVCGTFLTSCKSINNNVEILPKNTISGYCDIVFATYSDANTLAMELQSATNLLVTEPSEANLEKAKTAWRSAREVYGKTEAFRFYDGPIDNGTTGVEGLLNAWPLDEIYVDYVVGNQNTGIINNTEEYPTINKELLKKMNENGGEENISAGFHAIEFLLWGQDLDSLGPGNRPFSDYLPETKNAERRKVYLSTAVELLIENLNYLKLEWEAGKADNYRATFINDNPNISLQKIITGIAVLSKVEMAGERMFTAYDNANQEDEQSCFSDNTKSDLIFNLGGIINIFYGTYVRSDKTTMEVTGIDEIIKSHNVKLYEETEVLIKKCMNHLQQIYYPFDRAIVLEDKRPQVMKAVLSMQELGEQFAKVATELGLTINVNVVD